MGCRAAPPEPEQHVHVQPEDAQQRQSQHCDEDDHLRRKVTFVLKKAKVENTSCCSRAVKNLHLSLTALGREDFQGLGTALAHFSHNLTLNEDSLLVYGSQFEQNNQYLQGHHCEKVQ